MSGPWGCQCGSLVAMHVLVGPCAHSICEGCGRLLRCLSAGLGTYYLSPTTCSRGLDSGPAQLTLFSQAGNFLTPVPV